MRESSRRRWPTALPAIVAGSALSLAVASPAMAADTVAPVLAPAAFSATPNGNSNWRITAPQTLNLSATDDVAVSKFQYSLDGGATYVDVPVTAGPTATASRAAVAGGQHDGALPRGRQLGQLLPRRDHEHDLERRPRPPARPRSA